MTDESYNIIKEGKAEVKFASNVFYNPVQEFNRDLSIAVLSVFGEIFREEKHQKNNEQNTDAKTYEPGKVYDDGLSILEALSATGLRSVRYALEIPGLKNVVANDLSLNAVQSIKRTITHNKVEHLVTPNHDDATMLMYQKRKPDLRFTAIDLDPYGCPGIFLDSAVQAVCDGGLLLVTATDMAVLAGNAPETCYTKYGAVSLHTKSCHEMALRILLQCIEGHSNRYGRHIVPLLSVSIDFYIRVFVRVYTSPKECKKTTSKLGLVHLCTGCEYTVLQPLGVIKTVQPKQTSVNKQMNQYKYAIPTGPPIKPECDHCGSKYHTGGPVWINPLHDQTFVRKLLRHCESFGTKYATHLRMQGVLSVVNEEIDTPLYYTLEKLCSTLHIETIPIITLRSALLNSGYKVSYSHACKTSIKTDAPMQFLWDVLRTWEKEHPVKKSRLIPNVPVTNILQQPIQNEINFKLHKDANPVSRKMGFARFPENPTAHWGPGTRAKIMLGDGKMIKSIRNQNKKGNKRKADSVLDGSDKKEKVGV
ncbi:probable tRNA (guanine(26)-N(2))-dimethyltransferase [Ctenocephalides felis]|uniref:probable tRNA (guanine(26)-N(2))-dimethyltransferase n=1 Tax=Ctenocephalides felis TaxID=7515 RepID=UPI000E6E4A2D|nr:probable tRNA (guanine(26)-N(2))-dimethyltransferase [Ctenocephalides felis]